ncbi:MAG: hypothetical protein RBU37_23395 [Myxococcota bacterium]|nr:hypothetical protein [Myxococcota bacterium]
MKEVNVSSFSIQRALELSRLLSRSAEARTSPAASGASYVKFNLEPPPAAPAPVALHFQKPVEAPAPAPVPPTSFHNWDELLGWLISSYPFDAVFVLDAQGFIISHQGKWSYDEVEGLGANLLLANQQAQRLDQLGLVKQLLVNVADMRLAAMQFVRADKESYTVGMSGAHLASEDEYRQIRELLAVQVDIV